MRLAVLFLLAGCDRFFGLTSSSDGPDAAMVTPDTPRSAFSCPGETWATSFDSDPTIDPGGNPARWHLVDDSPFLLAELENGAWKPNIPRPALAPLPSRRFDGHTVVHVRFRSREAGGGETAVVQVHVGNDDAAAPFFATVGLAASQEGGGIQAVRLYTLDENSDATIAKESTAQGFLFDVDLDIDARNRSVTYRFLQGPTATAPLAGIMSPTTLPTTTGLIAAGAAEFDNISITSCD